MRVAHLDCETYSPVDLKSAGLSRYVESDDCDVLVLCYAIDDGDVQTWLPGDKPPVELTTCDRFHAWNAGFERAIWWRVLYRKYGWANCPPLDAWTCSMAVAQSYGLPGALDEAAMALQSPIRKDPRGAALMRFFCMPEKKTGRRRTRADDPGGYDIFIGGYCPQDVRTERRVLHMLPRQDFTASERRVWVHQMCQNERGIYVDVATAHAIAGAVSVAQEVVAKEAKAITAGIAPTQRAAVLEWLKTEADVELPNMQKETVTRMLATLPEGPAKRLLELRQSASKTSVRKYSVLVKRTSRTDSRLRYWGVYHGASTGRVTHKGFQPGNMPRGELGEDAKPHELIEQLWLVSEPCLLGVLYDPIQAYSAMIRSTLMAPPGRELLSGDYAQIEARILSWLAGQQDMLDVFEKGISPYSHMASKIYRLPVESIKKGSQKYTIAKHCVLGAGFGMGPDRFLDYSAKNGGHITPEEAHDAILGPNGYRANVPAIVQYWYTIKAAATNAVQDPGGVYTAGRVAYMCSKNGKWLACRLPNGRCIYYLRPRVLPPEVVLEDAHKEYAAAWAAIEEKPDDEKRQKRFERAEAQLARARFGPQLVCAGVDTYTTKWSEKVKLWHGTLVENIVQATARDVMAEAALRLEGEGYPVVLTVHDEIVTEATPDKSTERFVELMSEQPTWAPGLPIKVDFWRGKRYRK